MSTLRPYRTGPKTAIISFVRVRVRVCESGEEHEATSEGRLSNVS